MVNETNPEQDIEKLSELFVKKRRKIKLEDINAMKKLIIKSKKDLEASQLLFDAKLYSNSIYNLQQSCEKIVKTYAVLFGSLDSNNLKTVGHISPRAFSIMAESLDLERINRFFFDDKNKITKESLKNFNKILHKFKIKKLVKEQKELATIKYEEIEEVISSIENIRKDMVVQLNDKTIRSIVKEKPLPKNILNYFQFNKQIDKYLDVPFKDYVNLDFAIKYMVDYSLMYYLSVITFVHANITRYEDEKILYEEDYNENLGIVKASNLIRKELTNVIYRIEEIIKNYKI